MSYQHAEVLGVERLPSPLTTLSPSKCHCPTAAGISMCRAAQEGAAFLCGVRIPWPCPKESYSTRQQMDSGIRVSLSYPMCWLD